MIGMDARTGREMSGRAHVIQSIRDILMTMVGSRVMRRDYGSRLGALLDHPMTPDLLVECTQAIAEALARFEPRYEFSRLEVLDADSSGLVTLKLHGFYIEDGMREPIDLHLPQTGRT